MNAFAEDCGLDCIRQQLDSLESKHNIILGSLGPKLTAVSLFCLQRKNPDIGLVYAPAREFNERYSFGIGDTYRGTIDQADSGFLTMRTYAS